MTRILVADDEPSVRALIARVLRRQGHEVDEAVDGQDAIDKLRTDGYDALVLDLMMPRVDGFGVIEHLVEHSPRMVEKTVVTTAFPRTAIGGRLHHVCHVIAKPFELATLVSSVQDCVDAPTETESEPGSLP
jgi:CheY-like chemotaxis protein